MNFVPVEIIPTGIQVLYACSLGYHLASYLFECFDAKKRLCALICLLVALCVWERFYAVGIVYTLVTLFPIVRDSPRNLTIMRVHHILTILLILGSWIYHLTTIGAVVMFVNDITDVPMFVLRSGEKSKQCRYIVLAALVWVMWVAYRVVFMAYIMLRAYAMRNVRDAPPWFIVYTLLSALSVLLAFNIFWVMLLTSKMGRVIASK
jgi:hypothetical protein